MARQIQTKCGDCHGRGETFSDSDQCDGERTVNEEKVLEIYIDKGMKHRQKIMFRQEGNHLPNTEQGDLVVIVQVKPHNTFQRSGDDLIMTQKINICQALCGIELVVTHLDGRELLIKTAPGEIIKHDDLKAVQKEGMPIYKNPFEKGHLYIKFKVEFPDNNYCSLTQLKRLETVLPPRPVFVQPQGDFEDIDLLDYDTNDDANTRESRGKAYNNTMAKMRVLPDQVFNVEHSELN